MPQSVSARRARRPAPVRLPLPGQDPRRESQFLARLIAQWQPQTAIEAMWVEDIAYCSASIEHIRALISGFQQRCIAEAHARQMAPDQLSIDQRRPAAAGHTDDVLLGLYAVEQFSAPPGHSRLGEPAFAALLGSMTAGNHHQMRLLQAMLHDEQRERDRIINQLDRTRRQALREAIELVGTACRSGEADPVRSSAPVTLNNPTSLNEPVVSLEPPAEVIVSQDEELGTAVPISFNPTPEADPA